MLSLARGNAAGRCIRCAIRSQRLSLQQIRLGSNFGLERKSDDNKGFAIRYTGGPRTDKTSRKDGALRQRFNGPSDRQKGGGKRTKDFPETLQERLQAMKEELKDAPLVEHYLRERREAGDKKQDFGKLWNTFTKDLRIGAERQDRPFFGGNSSSGSKSEDLRLAFNKRGQRGLDDRIKYAFYGQVTGARFTESDIKNQKGLADLRYPTEWYPGTRSMHRTVHLHVGPTNSGKTYHALQRLEQAERGVYAGPLRLLAHEVYTRMTAKGKNCSLITGEERRVPEATADQDLSQVMTSCTVEMMPLNMPLDVAVIDEIQMIGNAERGWAWTQALLGVRAKEVHLCGEERTVPLIKELCASVGEKLVVHNYTRLSPLKVAEESLNGKIEDLRKGDCIVSFSVMGIHALRRQIERATGRKVATVYGSLPPETRAQQARLFNDPDNDYDFLVASDAIGMGLNLAIKRVVFEASNKFDGAARRTLSVADIKQIAGRAGRFRTAAQATEKSDDSTAEKSEEPVKTDVDDTVGVVTTLEKFDFPVVKAAMVSEPEPIRTAGIYPPATVLERFSSYFPPGTPFSYILTRLHELSLMHKRFHLCGLKDQVWVADLIEPVQGLTVADRNSICSAPASQTDADLWRELMPAYARIIAEQSGGSLVDIPQLPLEVLEAELSPSREYLRELERLHKGIVTYLWLSYRFAGLFNTRALAFHVKLMVEEKIEEVLSQFSFTEAQRRKIAAKREKDLLADIEGAAVDAEGRPIADASAGEDVPAAETEVHDYSELSSGAGYNAKDLEELQSDVLDEQTTLTSGGDRFGGEEDFGVEEPGEVDAEIEAQLETDPAKVEAASSSFTAWRSEHTKVDSEAAPEPEEGILETAYQDGEEAGRKEVQNNTLEALNESEPAVADIQPSIAATKTTSASDKATSLEQDPLDLDSAITVEADLPSDQPPVATQEVSPTATAAEDQTSEQPARKE
jgi:ATP-dependent RNA helicase SUPV3L1/SUV3